MDDKRYLIFDIKYLVDELSETDIILLHLVKHDIELLERFIFRDRQKEKE